MKYTKKVYDYLGNAIVKMRNPEKSPDGRVLWEIFLWQLIASKSKKYRDIAWDKAVKMYKLIPDDDSIRTMRGEQVLATSEHFVCVATVEEGRAMFDEAEYSLMISRKYKIDPGELAELAAKCIKRSKPVLTKRVIEKGVE